MPPTHLNNLRCSLRFSSFSLACLGLAGVVTACGSDDSPTALDPDELLLDGDAEWPQAPIPQPGGNGEPGSDSGGGDEGGASTGGDGDGDGDNPGEFMCLDPGEELTCGDQPGVCEAVPTVEPVVEIIACCTDEDCECADGLCSSSPCVADGWCDCNCPMGIDPDCDFDSCALPAAGDEDAVVCPTSTDPVVLYMSNDDSNSQASPAFVRRLVADKHLVKASNVRIYEFLNYYDLTYESPTNSRAKVGIQMRRTNKDTGEFTLLLSAQGQRLEPEQRPRFNLSYSLDMSGSMAGEPIALLKDTVRATASQLRAGDTISMVGWDTLQSTLLDGHVVSGPNDPALLAAIDEIEAGGGTNLHSGLVSAYALAHDHYIEDGINRVLIISDGGANAGVTDIELIAAEANEQDGAGIYLIGVGVIDSWTSYNDKLMDDLTDAGKGAYLFIDSTQEAERMFADPIRFLANTTVAARNVQMQLTMPWYFGIKEFHGEEYSADPAEVEPQHLAYNDAMSFHQIIQSCDPNAPLANDTIKAMVTYLDPDTLEQRSDEYQTTLAELVAGDATQLYKGDVIVSYAKTFIAIDAMIGEQQTSEAIATAAAMVEWLELAATTLNDPEIAEMVEVMEAYRLVLVQRFG